MVNGKGRRERSEGDIGKREVDGRKGGWTKGHGEKVKVKRCEMDNANWAMGSGQREKETGSGRRKVGDEK